jgi:hypothetical protein
MFKVNKNLCHKIVIIEENNTVSSSTRVLRSVVSLKMAYPRSKHVALLET